MRTVTFEVLHSVWGADEEVFEGGLHEDVPATPELVRLLAGAEAAGVVVIHDEPEALRKQLDGHVQSQEDGEAALVAAQGNWVRPVYAGPRHHQVLVAHGYWDGPWQHGNLVQAVVDLEDVLAYDETLEPGDDDKLTDEDRATIEHKLGKVKAQLDKTEEPT